MTKATSGQGAERDAKKAAGKPAAPAANKQLNGELQCNFTVIMILWVS